MSFNECQNIMNKYNINNNININFYNYVYSKISKNTKNRYVEKENDCIDILLFNHPCIKVIPIFKYINKDNLNLKEEIKIASNIINKGEFSFVYFVYPKNEQFNKHIQLKIKKLEEACSEYTIKIIPYSLNDLIKKKQGNCNGNSNILCK